MHSSKIISKTAKFFSVASIGVAMLGSHSPASAECNPGDFKAQSIGSLSFAQHFSHFQSSSQSSSDDDSASGNLTVPIEGVPVEFGFSRQRERYNRSSQTSLLNTQTDYTRSWAESALDANGLAGYLGCLRTEEGFHTVVQELASLNILQVVWVPGQIGNMSSHPEIVASDNVSNVAEIQAQLEVPSVWGSVARTKELVVRRDEPAKVASLTLRDGNNNDSVVVFPLRTVAPPYAGPTFEFTAADPDPNGNTIVYEIPVDAIGKPLFVSVDGDAFTRGRGKIRGVIKVVRTDQTERPIDATPWLTQSGNMGVEMDTSFIVEADDYLVTIRIPNDNAEARGVTATFRY